MSLEKFYQKNIDKYIDKISIYLKKINKNYVNNPYYIVNPVLSNNAQTSNFLKNYMKYDFFSKKYLLKRNLLKKILFIIIYYIKSFLGFIFFLLHLVIYKTSRLNRTNKINKMLKNTTDEIIIVDTFTMIDRIYKDKAFNDNYFLDYYKILEEDKRDYFVLCFLFGDKPYNLKRRLKTYNILAKDKRVFITEFDLLSINDYYKILKFIIFYPFKTLKLLKTAKNENIDLIFKDEVLNTLKNKQFENFARYLIGKKLGKKLKENKKKLILFSWFENQVIHQLLYLGIRISNVQNYIIGTQFFTKTPSFYHFDEFPDNDKLLPNEIMVKGKAFLKENKSIKYTLGVSTRETYIKNFKLDDNIFDFKKNITVMLTYFIDDSQYIIELTNKIKNMNIFVKMHPNHRLNNPFVIPSYYKIIEKENREIFKENDLIITGGSGVVLEAISCGCSVLIIAAKDSLPLSPLFTNYGKGIIWDLVFDEDELEEKTNDLLFNRKNNKNKILEISNYFRKNLYNFEYKTF